MWSLVVAAIAGDRLTKRYGRTTVVDHVSLVVEPGEIYGFLGLNGAGKTTTMRMLLGMIKPTNGHASILGHPVSARADKVWERVGHLVESPSAYRELTVRENLEIVRRLRGLRDTNAVGEVIDRLALGPYADRPAGTLSLGNAQRLGLAKALIHRPRVLLLDEPVNGLDPAGVVEVREMLRSLADDGVTVFMSSHLLTEVARIATRIGIIHHGRLIEEQTREELERRCERRLVINTSDNRAARAILAATGFPVARRPDGMLALESPKAVTDPGNLAAVIIDAGLALTHLAVEDEDLESHFLRLVADTPAPEITAPLAATP